MATPNGTNGQVNGAQFPALSTSAEDFIEHNYDYLIVGGGTAGLAIAARLTENADVTVGVLEAGANKLNDILVDTPALFMQTFNNPDYDWQHMTVPQVSDPLRNVERVANRQTESQQEQNTPYPKRQSSGRQ
jgi:choline dehydrogenase-like flavoprotein